MSRHRKALCGAPGHGLFSLCVIPSLLFSLCVKPSLLLSVSERGIPKVKNTCLMFLPRFPDPGRDRDVAKLYPDVKGDTSKRTSISWSTETRVLSPGFPLSSPRISRANLCCAKRPSCFGSTASCCFCALRTISSVSAGLQAKPEYDSYKLQSV